MTPESMHLLMLPIIGLVAGVLGGLLGVGGGIVMIPAMWWLLPAETYGGTDRLLIYQLAALATAVVLSAPAARRHAQAGVIVRPILRGMIPAAVIGVGFGVVLANLFVWGGQAPRLRQLFGVFMVLAAVADLLRARLNQRGQSSQRLSCPVPWRRGFIGSVVGLPAGLISGLFGVGGGIWAVPAQNVALGVRLPNAIANSACTIVVAAAVAAVAKSIAITRVSGLDLLDGWWLALWLAPGAVVGGWFGGALTHRLPVRWIRYAFCALLLTTGLRLMLQAD